MYSKIFRYVVIPVGVGGLAISSFSPSAAAAVAVHANQDKAAVDISALYDDLNRQRGRRLAIEDVRAETDLEAAIAKCRKQVVPLKDSVAKSACQVTRAASDAKNSILEKMDYLQKTAPPEVKIGTIVGSGFVGLLMGLRRGTFRKLIYASVWSASAGTLIYPGDAKIVAERGSALSKKYSAIAYHFVVGAQPKQSK